MYPNHLPKYNVLVVPGTVQELFFISIKSLKNNKGNARYCGICSEEDAGSPSPYYKN